MLAHMRGWHAVTNVANSMVSLSHLTIRYHSIQVNMSVSAGTFEDRSDTTTINWSAI